MINKQKLSKQQNMQMIMCENKLHINSLKIISLHLKA